MVNQEALYEFRKIKEGLKGVAYSYICSNWDFAVRKLMDISEKIGANGSISLSEVEKMLGILTPIKSVTAELIGWTKDCFPLMCVTAKEYKDETWYVLRLPQTQMLGFRNFKEEPEIPTIQFEVPASEMFCHTIPVSEQLKNTLSMLKEEMLAAANNGHYAYVLKDETIDKMVRFGFYDKVLGALRYAGYEVTEQKQRDYFGDPYTNIVIYWGDKEAIF